MRDPAWASRALIAAALAIGLASLPGVVREVEQQMRGADVAVVDDVSVIRGMPQGTPELIAHLRRARPARSPVRVVNRGGVCRRVPLGQGQGLVYWLQYQLLPRALTCDPAAPWTLYTEVVPPAPAPGASRVVFGPGLVLDRAATAAR